MPAISVIVPVYNVEKYLPQCIDSIRAQTLRDIEIVCVVDGSTDGSEDILRLYAKVDPRIRIVCKENGGLSSARNAGIDASTAPILMFVDSDDAIAPDACLMVLAAFEAEDAEMVTFGGQCMPACDSNPWYDRVLVPRDTYYPAFDPAIVFKEASHPFVWRTAVRRTLLDREGLRFDETRRFGEDELFHFEAYPKARGVVFMHDRLYLYRIVRKDSLMASRLSDDLLKCREHISIAERICASWRRYGILRENGVAMIEWAAEFVVYNCMIVPNDGWRELFDEIEGLFGEYMVPEDAFGMKFGLPLQDLCAALARREPIEAIAQLRVEYLTFIRYHDDVQSWLPPLAQMRHTAAMPLHAARRRLQESAASKERELWLAADEQAREDCLGKLANELGELGEN